MITLHARYPTLYLQTRHRYRTILQNLGLCLMAKLLKVQCQKFLIILFENIHAWQIQHSEDLGEIIIMANKLWLRYF